MSPVESKFIRNLWIAIATAFAIQIVGSLFLGVKVANKDHFTIIRQGEKIELNTSAIAQKIDKERIDEIMKLMKDYHDVAMEAMKTNSEECKDRMEVISKRIDEHLRDHNTQRGGVVSKP